MYTDVVLVPMLPVEEPAVRFTVVAVNTSLELALVMLPDVALLPVVVRVIVPDVAVMFP